MKFDCKTSETVKGRWWRTECGGRDIGEDKGSTYTGPVDFAIKMRNELAKTDVTLFTGKAKVAKVHTNEVGPKAANKFVYYVDHDWNLPIGYLFLKANEVDGMNKPSFNAVFWTRGDASGFQPHLFFQGKEVGNLMFQGEQVGKPSCDVEVDNTTTLSVDDSLPQKARWSRVVCTFFSVLAWDKTGRKPGGPLPPPYVLAGNAGDYEFKLLWKDHLARSIKFTVKADGTFDNGIAAATTSATIASSSRSRSWGSGRDLGPQCVEDRRLLRQSAERVPSAIAARADEARSTTTSTSRYDPIVSRAGEGRARCASPPPSNRCISPREPVPFLTR